MLNFFKDGELPGIDGELFASRDVSSYLEIWHSAQQLENICLLNGGKQGWTSQGTVTKLSCSSNDSLIGVNTPAISVLLSHSLFQYKAD